MPYEKIGKRYIIKAGAINSALIKTKVLPMSYYDIDNKGVSFSNNSVVSLLDFFNDNTLIFDKKYNLLVKMISDLSIQLQLLKSHEYYMIGIDFEDICVVDGNIFVIHRDTNFIKGKQLLIPFKKPMFSSPEVLEITKLPSALNTNGSDSYYSLGLLVIYIINNNLLNNKNEISNKFEDIQLINGTKMYYFLERAINQRKLLYI
jgi:hypothetical protein